MSTNSEDWKQRGEELKKQRAFIVHCLLWDIMLTRGATRTTLRKMLNVSLETINKILEDDNEESITPSTARKVIKNHAEYFKLDPVIYTDIVYQVWQIHDTGSQSLAKFGIDEPEKREMTINVFRERYLQMLAEYRMSSRKSV